MTISLLSEPSSLYAQPVDLTGSIENVKSETVILVSNNMLGGSVVSNSKEDDNSFSGSIPLIISYVTQENIFNKNKSFNKGYFIHNLSTDKQKVQQIRAP